MQVFLAKKKEIEFVYNKLYLFRNLQQYCILIYNIINLTSVKNIILLYLIIDYDLDIKKNHPTNGGVSMNKNYPVIIC